MADDINQSIVELAALQNESRPPEYSDEALALAFADQHEGALCYVAAWGHWYIWTGTQWQRDDTMLAFSHARAVCRKAAAACNDQIRRQVASAKTVASVERLAKADRRLVATTDQWDSDSWLLNTPGSAIDLRKGTSRPHCPDDYQTKITAVSPGGDCPMWLEFLKRITDGDDELIAYLRRLTGYSLTGSTREHVLAFFHGVGANGKSVFLSTVAGALGDYHRTAPVETFTASNTDRHPTELAMLRGARLVTAVETEQGRRWAESRIKTLTGGDRIAARFMRADFFEYEPQFTLVIAGNHRPGLRSVDEAIRRRFHLVPFSVVIPPEERDERLPEKLKEEWPGILQWMIDGCLAWQEDGLNAPAVVREATETYLEGQDALSAWLEESCELDANAWEDRTDLYVSWKAWAERAGEHVMSRTDFYDVLERHGLVPHRQPGKGTRGFNGARIRRHDYTDEARYK